MNFPQDIQESHSSILIYGLDSKLISDDKDAINYIQEDYFGSFHCNGKQ